MIAATVDFSRALADSLARWMKRYAISASITGAALGAIILGAWGNDLLPVAYLYRPLAAVGVIALLASLIAVAAGRHAPLLALAIGTLIVRPPLALPVTIVLATGLAAVLAAGMRGHRWEATGPLAIAVAAFLAVSVVRAVPLLDPRLPDGNPTISRSPTYLVLLDGYPRIDTLAAMGIDDRPFISELERRGFDFYPNATSVHSWTVLTLTAVLTGEVVPDGQPTMDLKRAVRPTWRLPAGWLAIDPPVGNVTIPGVPHIDPGGVNDLEAYLLGESLLGALGADPVRAWLAADLVTYHRVALDALATSEATRVFAHLLAPHPPFVLGSDPTANCWPQGCHFYQSAIERTNLTAPEWREGMATQLEGLQPLLLEAIDRILDRRPNATIVLFSDHGGRESYADLEEWHRSFLAARTPGRPMLFEDEPHPHAIHRLIFRYAAEESGWSPGPGR